MNIKVPKGKHGTDAVNFRTKGTEARTGTPYYLNKECSGNPAGYLILDSESIAISSNNYYEDTKTASIQYNNQKVYLREENLWKRNIVYDEINYETSSDGVKKEKIAGPYNMIKSISSDENGVISVEYTYDEPETLGKITFILETLVTEENNDYNVPAHHLLVLFSNYGGSIKYYSKRFNKVIEGYIDLGYVKGDPGPGLSIIAKYNNVSEIPTPPNSNNIPGYTIGDAVTVGENQLYVFDVNTQSWIFIGTIDNVNPSNIIRFDEEQDILNLNGLHIVTSTIKFVE